MRCIILRELLTFAVLQVIGSPISSHTANSQITQGQWENSHYTGHFPYLCSEKLYLNLEDSREKKGGDTLNICTQALIQKY